ncbi:MAG TPA: hypothetical protein ACFCUC_14115, partial [Desulfobacterales bacterium]
MPAESYRQLARHYLYRRQQEEVEAVFAVARERYPESLRNARLEADYWKVYGNPEEAAAAWDRLVEANAVSDDGTRIVGAGLLA